MIDLYETSKTTDVWSIHQKDNSDDNINNILENIHSDNGASVNYSILSSSDINLFPYGNVTNLTNLIATATTTVAATVRATATIERTTNITGKLFASDIFLSGPGNLDGSDLHRRNVSSDSIVNSVNNGFTIKREPLVVVISMTVLYSLIFVSGLLGNIITCIVIAKNRAMHTATNYYLFSLAISDLLLLISGMPFEIYEIWFRFQPYPFGESVCILQGFAAETSANATVLTITAFTAERYIAICHPFLSHTMSKLSRAIKFILGIWLLAMGLAIPQILDLGIIEKYETCGPKNDERKYVFTISSIVCFVFPMIIITVFYILIGLQLRKSKIVGRSTTANGNSIRMKTKYRIPSTKRNILVTLDKDEKTNPLLIPPLQNPSIMEVVYNDTKDPNQRTITTTKRCYEEGRKNFSQNRYMGSRHVINMLVAVVVAFFVCWAPHHAQRIFAMNAEQKHADIYDIITPISGVLYYISTCINPLLYNIMSYKFREAFKNTCSRWWWCCCSPYHDNADGFGRRFHYGSERHSRNLSQRSNSHSVHTCSSICSGQIMQQVNSCMNLDQDLSLIKCTTKRPLKVTFRKPGRNIMLNINTNNSSNTLNLNNNNNINLNINRMENENLNQTFVMSKMAMNQQQENKYNSNNEIRYCDIDPDEYDILHGTFSTTTGTSNYVCVHQPLSTSFLEKIRIRNKEPEAN